MSGYSHKCLAVFVDIKKKKKKVSMQLPWNMSNT